MSGGLQIIERNRIVSVEVPGALPGFPANNLLDNHPSNSCKVGPGGDVVITAKTIGTTNALMLVNSFFYNVEASIESDFNRNWAPVLSGDSVSWEAPESSNTVNWANNDFENKTSSIDTRGRNVFIQWPETVAPLTITLTIARANDRDWFGGGIRAGLLTDLGQYNWNVQEGRKNYGAEEQLQGGSWYEESGPIVRVFSGTVTARKRSDFRKILELYDRIGRRPIVWKIFCFDNAEYLVFGRMPGDGPTGAYESLNSATLNLTIEEVV